MGQNKRRFGKNFHVWNRVRLSLKGKNILVNQTLFSKLWYIWQIFTIPKYIKKNIKKRIYNFLWNRKKYNIPDNKINLPPPPAPIWRGGLVIFDIDTQLNYIRIKWIQGYYVRTMLFEKISSCTEINSEFWSCQGLTLFRQKQILTGLLITKISLFNYPMLGYI